MIPPLSGSPAYRPIYREDSKSVERRTHLVALAVIASLALLAIAPLELAIPFAICILLVICIGSVSPQPRVRVNAVPMPGCMETVHVVHPPSNIYINPLSLPQTRFAAPSGRAPVGTGGPTRFAPPTGRAPVGTGGPTRFAPPTGRAPVGTGGPTRFAPPTGRAPVGTGGPTRF